MRDPRNWIRPVAAVVIGGAAAGGLVVVRARQQHRGRGGRGHQGARAERPRRHGPGPQAPQALADRAPLASAVAGVFGSPAWPGPRPLPPAAISMCRTLSPVLMASRPRRASFELGDEPEQRDERVDHAQRQRVEARARVIARQARPTAPVTRCTTLCHPLTARTRARTPAPRPRSFPPRSSSSQKKPAMPRPRARPRGPGHRAGRATWRPAPSSALPVRRPSTRWLSWGTAEPAWRVRRRFPRWRSAGGGCCPPC